VNIRLNGISFIDLPHIGKGEEVVVVREEGEPWDSEARPAYSVRLDCMHIGYVPLVETVKEEALKARSGYRKKWKDEFDGLTREEIRRIAKGLNERGEMVQMRDWEFIGKEQSKGIAKNKMRECETVEIVRDWLYTEIMRNHLTPHGRALPLYYDEKHGRNYAEIGEICSISVALDDIW